MAQKVRAIQIVPVKLAQTNGPNSEGKRTHFSRVFLPQPAGADADTVYYSVNARLQDGTYVHVDDKEYEADAIKLAQELCEKHTVAIEIPDWMIPYLSQKVIMANQKRSIGSFFKQLFKRN